MSINSGKRLIHLSQSENIFELDIHDNLQGDAFERVREHLVNHDSILSGLKKNVADSRLKNIARCRMHNAIFVSGSRGSGKTAILHSIPKLLKDPFLKIEKVEALDVIDPTMLASSDDIIVVILSRLAKRVKAKFCTESHSKERREFDRLYSEIGAILKPESAVAGMDMFIDKACRLDLEEKIHEVFMAAANMLGVNYFLLPVDDIDISFSIGHKLMEAIRKYMTTPYVLPVISGDFKMYHQIFATEFYDALTHKLNVAAVSSEEFDKEFYHEAEFAGTVDSHPQENYLIKKAISLSNEYLIKVVPKSRHIPLMEIEELLKHNESNLVIVSDSAGGNQKTEAWQDLEEKIIRLLNRGISLKRKNILIYPKYRSLREYIQFLVSLRSLVGKGKDKLSSADFKQVNAAVSYLQKSGVDAPFIAACNIASLEQGDFSIRKFIEDNIFKYCIKRWRCDDGGKPIYTELRFFISKENLRNVNFENASSNVVNSALKLIYEHSQLRNGNRYFLSADRFFWLLVSLFAHPEEDVSEIVGLIAVDKDCVNKQEPAAEEALGRISVTREFDLAGALEHVAPDFSKYLSEKMDVSANLLAELYMRYADNVDGIGPNGSVMPLGSFFARLTLIFVNALAYLTLDEQKLTENKIATKEFDAKKLKNKDLAFRWNVKTFFEKHPNFEKLYNAFLSSDSKLTVNIGVPPPPPLPTRKDRP